MGFDLDNISTGTKKKEQPKTGAGINGLLQKEITLFGKSFSNKQKEDFYAELSILLKAGITLKQALSLIRENRKKKKETALLDEMSEGIVNGKSFSEVTQGRKEFTAYEYQSIKIGEETGTLYKVTEELGHFYARKNEQKRVLIAAITYPVIIVFTAFVVVLFMLRFVVPMFQDIFKQNNVELPAITKLIVRMSEVLNKHGFLLFVVLIAMVVLFKIASGKEWFKRRRDHLVLKIPYAGALVKNVYMVQFTQAVTLLTSAHVPILNSIRLVSRMISFYPLKDALAKVEEKIMKGESLSDSLSDTKIFDNKMISLVKVAEETNQTEFIFERLHNQYAMEVQQKSKLLSTVLEPLIILFVGIVVGFILIAMYLPMFKLSSVLG